MRLICSIIMAHLSRIKPILTRHSRYLAASTSWFNSNLSLYFSRFRSRRSRSSVWILSMWIVATPT